MAHSLGTVLSYMALANHPQWGVHTFVTLGSPLASPMIFDQLDPAGRRSGLWPGTIGRWVNVRAIGDKAAAVPLREVRRPSKTCSSTTAIARSARAVPGHGGHRRR